MNCGRRLEETNGVFPLERCWTRGSTKRRRELELLSLFAIRESEKVNGGGQPFKGKNGLTMGVVLV